MKTIIAFITFSLFGGPVIAYVANDFAQVVVAFSQIMP